MVNNIYVFNVIYISAYRILDTFKGETRTPEFIKLNPQHTVPTFDDNGDVIGDGHAIVTYLVTKYGGAKHASLCPTEPLARARVDHRLHFNNSTLFNRFGKLISPIFRGAEKEFNKENLDSVLESLDMLEAFLVDDYVAGKELTVADFAVVSSVTTIIMLISNDLSKLPRTEAWIKRLEQLPYYDEVITKNLEVSKSLFAEKLGLKF